MTRNALPAWAEIVLLPLANIVLAFLAVGVIVVMIGVNPFEALKLLVLGALVTLVAAAVALILAYFWARAGVISSLGATSGMQTQPAALAAAFDLCGQSEATYVAYALVYPIAMIGKILVAQLIVLLA